MNVESSSEQDSTPPLDRTVLAAWAAWARALDEVLGEIVSRRPGALAAPSPRVVGFAPLSRGRGASRLAFHYALCVAQRPRSGRETSSVLLVDADLGQPAQHLLSGGRPSPGLSEVFSREASLQEAAALTSFPALWLLPAGESPWHADSGFRSGELTLAWLERLRGWAERFGRIVVDFPPLDQEPSAAWLAPGLDALFLVARSSKERFEHLRQVRKLLRNRIGNVQIVVALEAPES